jgi:hypothetical protein
MKLKAKKQTVILLKSKFGVYPLSYINEDDVVEIDIKDFTLFFSEGENIVKVFSEHSPNDSVIEEIQELSQPLWKIGFTELFSKVNQLIRRVNQLSQQFNAKH